MAQTQHNNPCIICGKQRIVSTTSQETVGNSIVTRTQMICPDPECQKKLDTRLHNEKVARDKAAEEKLMFVNKKRFS